MTYRKTQDTSVPSSLNAPIFSLYFANRCKNRNETELLRGHAALTFSMSLSSVNDRNSTSSRLQNIKNKINFNIFTFSW